VSNDIRTLAREASENVERAKDTVQGILDQIAILQRDLEQIIAAAEIEVQNNRAVSASLQRVGSEAEALGKEAGSSSPDPRDSGGRSRDGAGRAPNRSCGRGSERCVARSGDRCAEQSQGAEDLAAAIEEIGSLADELKSQNA
jgi:methyl-accepting chemotaxis protein